MDIYHSNTNDLLLSMTIPTLTGFNSTYANVGKTKNFGVVDEFERNDNIYIVRNRNGINAENLATVLKQNDIKKSDAYQSGFLEGTTPMYDSYIKLKKSLIQFHKEEV